MTSVARPRSSFRFRGRSFLAFVLAPEPPMATWFAELDAWSKRSPSFFAGRPIVLDLSGLELGKRELSALLADLAKRDIRIMGLEGVESSMVDLRMPPLVSGGREAGDAELAGARAGGGRPGKPAQPRPSSLLIEDPVRSGQSIAFPAGDITVMGSVGSGAEIMAGGSVHIYGALRGRVIAGSAGNSRARIFCRKLEAELLAIDGFYRTADDMDEKLRGRPVQAWLEGETVMMASLD